MSVKTSSKRRVKVAVNPPSVANDLHVTGKSRFISDEPIPAGMCFVKVVASPHAHARIVRIDVKDTLSMAGVVAVLTSADVPAENQIGSKIKDQPLLPDDEVYHVGQPVVLVVGESESAATEGAKRVQVEYETLEAVLSMESALAKRSLIAPELKIARGDLEGALRKSMHTLSGTVSSGSQEHVYFETQRARAIPGEDQEITIFASTQAPSEVQEVAARVLGLARKDITVDVRRLGGGFGGKESVATLWACLAALACRATRRPVELRLTRVEDMRWTGKRHPFQSSYRVGFDDEGRVLAYEVELNADGGAFADLTMAILQRAMLHADNAYFIPNVQIRGRAVRTNYPPNTAFRGFGAPQGIFVIESVIQRIAFLLGKDPMDVRKLNAYDEGKRTPYGQAVREARGASLLQRLERTSHYKRLHKETDAFNAENRFAKRGIGVVPVKFGISFTSPFLNQGSALVQVYADGSISVSHGGIEMGQGLNMKVAQIVAGELGVTLDRVRVESNNTKRTANASPTAASTGADINGRAALDAARQISDRLRTVAAAMLSEKLKREVDPARIAFAANVVKESMGSRNGVPFSAVAHEAWMTRTDLAAHGFYKTPGIFLDWATGKGSPFAYFVNGCALAVAEVDVLTGMFAVKRAHIVHETATTVNSAVDRGQIEGAFMQGLGWCTMEEIVHDGEGRTLTESLTTYKIPTLRDLPEVLEVEMIVEERKFAGVMGSKAVGEPPLIYGQAVFFAIKDAIEAVAGHEQEVFLAHPATPESVLRAIEDIHSREGRS